MLSIIYKEYRDLGIKVIPIQWDTANNQPISHRNWSAPDDLVLRETDNAIMILTGNDYACLDFDIKNTDNKALFSEWMTIVTNDAPEILRKVFIEKTRNNGYHLWFKYDALPKKTALADNKDGNEVIALYANGPVVYTFPTPGYTEFHQNMGEIEMLNENEYNYIISVSQYFNEYKPDYDPNLKAISYPEGYEEKLSEFDLSLSDMQFETILKMVGLIPIPNFRYSKRDKFKAYRREGSTSAGISAKVYFGSKRVMIFSASMASFPNWHNKEDYPVWCLPASFLLFYHFGRSWDEVIKYIGLKKINTGYPYYIFPQSVEKSIHEVSKELSLDPVFLATSGLWTIASLAGNCYYSDFGSSVKNIIFALLVAPVSVGKTPAFKLMCEDALSAELEKEDKQYKLSVAAWNLEKTESAQNKQAFSKPHPKRFHSYVADGTTEGYISIMQDQEGGMGVYHDEAESILNAGAHKANNDSITFFTQAFSGGRYTQIRADRAKERVVKSLNISIMMGTQPSRLNNIFGQDKIESGFASRFLMVESGYRLLNEDADPFSESRRMCNDWIKIVSTLYNINKEFSSGERERIKIGLTNEARDLFRLYNKRGLKASNENITNKIEGHILATEAKMSAYFPRLCHLVAIISNQQNPIITTDVVTKSWELYRFYAESTLKIISKIKAEVDSGMPAELQLLYNTLPLKFTIQQAEEICAMLNLRHSKFKESMRRKDFGSLFKRITLGNYEKL